jgi:predicted Zn finger-like uncharacterized protein
MSHAITRCPKCETSFRVTTSQLDSADGAVRCGSCLHVFDARSNFIGGPAAEQSSTEPATIQPTADQPAAEQPVSQQPTTEHPRPTATPTPTISAAKDDDDFLISDDMNIPPGADDDLTIDFDDGGSGDSEVNSNIDLGELAPEFREQRNADETSSSQAENGPEEQEEAVDESWAHALLEELDSDLAEADENANERLRREIDNRFDGRQTGSFDVLQEEFDSDFDKYISETPIEDKPALDQDTGRYNLKDFEDTELGKHLNKPPAHKPPGGGRPTTSFTLTNAFEPEPLELTYEPSNTRRWLTGLGWLTGNLVLALALIVQVGYLKFDSWSLKQPYRQWYAIACPVFGCTLPAVDDFNKIKISLVVRTDPNNSAVLQADAILINTANFNQPFPPLALRFSDLNDEVVAERVFLPSEYLRGELSNATEIPPNQPMQLRLELADPGQSAVNYRAYIPTFK